MNCSMKFIIVQLFTLPIHQVAKSVVQLQFVVVHAKCSFLTAMPLYQLPLYSKSGLYPQLWNGNRHYPPQSEHHEFSIGLFIYELNKF